MVSDRKLGMFHGFEDGGVAPAPASVTAVRGSTRGTSRLWQRAVPCQDPLPSKSWVSASAKESGTRERLGAWWGLLQAESPGPAACFTSQCSSLALGTWSVRVFPDSRLLFHTGNITECPWKPTWLRAGKPLALRQAVSGGCPGVARPQVAAALEGPMKGLSASGLLESCVPGWVTGIGRYPGHWDIIRWLK